MSDTPRTITLRPLQPGESPRDGDFYMSTDGPDAGDSYRVVNPIPDGYEACDLSDATKVLIGETWIEKMSGAFTCGGLQLWPFRIEGLGVLAIRPIHEPEPMKGEAEVIRTTALGGATDWGSVKFPVHLIGKRVRWEVIE